MSPSPGRAGEPDLYALLGVPADTDADGIARAFRRRALAEHPDHGGDPAAFRELQRGRETLMDPGRRAAYDRRRAATAGTGPAGAGPSRSGTPASDGPSPPRPGASDPFAWSAGSGSRFGFREHADTHRPHGGETPADEPAHSWRRADRFAWWRTEEPPERGRRRRRGARGRGWSEDRPDQPEG
ncbi:DnaJ domain-containing protein [Streptomyces alkaliphilus]|uniref:DnaJ domain-containing protein n=1 Tax=Streptomyces alkaliphilus TaxID=1472722 RepID=A0A7W3Y1D2_9ACTN|nr:DnaJ domain-containing protein [Streptomyces alkaliphilus]MBB0244378.1 DnaJ domain-containing protein [Streptomyces alkaliphilus]